MSAPYRATYLGADRSGAEFWLCGPHVFSTASGGSSPRHVCAFARFNRHARSNRRARLASRGRPPHF